VNKTVTVMEKMKRVSVLTLENEEYGVTISYEITDTAKENYIETRSKLLSEECLAADHIKAVKYGGGSGAAPGGEHGDYVQPAAEGKHLAGDADGV